MRDNTTKEADFVPGEEPLWAKGLFVQVQRAARALARCLDAELRPLGSTHGQLILLMLLNRQEPISRADLVSILTIDRTTLTAALKARERRELVIITDDPSDHRVRRMKLTRRGRALVMTSVPVLRLPLLYPRSQMPRGKGFGRRLYFPVQGSAYEP